MNLDFGRCQVYKLNISACLTERELDYYNLFCDGITRKELKKRLGVDYPTSEMLSEEFHISLEDAADLLKAQMNKKCFRKFLTDEIEKFSPNEVREIRKSAIYVADEEGNLTDRIKDNKKMQQIMKTDMGMNIKLFRLGRIKKKQTKTEDWQRFIIEYVKGMSIQ